MAWFEVDKDGLKQMQEGKDRSFILRETVQNSWDEPGVTECRVTLRPIPGRPLAALVVEDDAPEGFYDLRHAYTLYAGTRKRKDPTQRGRFNLGNKEVLSLCRNAQITTTKGTIIFDESGERRKGRRKREAGSVFQGDILMTREQLAECEKAIKTFISPPGIKTLFNEKALPVRKPIATIEATLGTEYEDEQGRYRTTSRKTIVEVYEPLEGEQALIYELGLPIIETGDKWHYNILQRVPMDANRDNVKPSFLRDVRAYVTNELADEIEESEASDKWIRDACSDPLIEEETLLTVADKRWGEKRCVPVPGDRKSREDAIAHGYHIVGPSTMDKAEWEQMKRAGAVPSTKEKFPRLTTGYEVIPSGKWTDGMVETAMISKVISDIAFGWEVGVMMITSDASTAADYSSKLIRFNVTRLGEEWFTEPLQDRIELIIHELGHHNDGDLDHFDRHYYDTLCMIGAKLALIDWSDYV